MKTSLLQIVLVWHLMGIITGDFQNIISKIVRPKSVRMPLNMSYGSFDDQYKNCDPGMEDKLKDPLQTDFASVDEYTNVWHSASERWKGLPGDVRKSLEPQYGTAVVTYTYGDSYKLYRDFNRAVREARGSTSFAFKSFHFLLTKALQVLKDSQNRCYQTYRGVKDIHFTISDRSQPVRFGQFASSSRNKVVAQNFLGHKGTLFTIQTCFGILIKEFSIKPTQEEVLIPPYETFRVSEFNDNGAVTNITLKSTGKVSTYNCGVSKAAGPIHLSANILVLSFLSGILLVSGTLGSPDIF